MNLNKNLLKFYKYSLVYPFLIDFKFSKNLNKNYLESTFWIFNKNNVKFNTLLFFFLRVLSNEQHILFQIEKYLIKTTKYKCFRFQVFLLMVIFCSNSPLASVIMKIFSFSFCNKSTKLQTLNYKSKTAVTKWKKVTQNLNRRNTCKGKKI